MRTPVLLITLLLVLPGLARDLRADEATEDQVKGVLARFKDEGSSRDADTREAALRRLGEVRHPDVADRLLKELRRERDPRHLRVIFEGLSRQTDSAEKIGPMVEKMTAHFTAEVAETLKKGDLGFLRDPRTGDAETGSEEGKAVLEARAARDQMVAAGLRCLLDLGYHERLDTESFPALLQSAEDELVVAALDAIAEWEEWSVLPAVLKLYRMYPSESRWETGAVVHAGGTNATAKAEWMAHFGHPKKQDARPEVVKAIQKTVLALAECEVEEPEDLEALLRRPEIKAKMNGRRR